MQRLYITYLIFAVLLLAGGCVKWNLEEQQIHSFNWTLESGHPVGFMEKNEVLQLPDNSYVISGIGLNDTVLVSQIAEDGTLLLQKEFWGYGEGRSLVFVHDSLRILVSNDTTSFLLTLNKNYTVSKVDSIGMQMDTTINPFSKHIVALDLLVSKDGNLLLTGQVRQSSSQSQIILCKFAPGGPIIWYQLFSNGTKGWSLHETDGGKILLFAENNGQILLLFCDEGGSLEWFRPFDNTGINNWNSATSVKNEAYLGTIRPNELTVAKLSGEFGVLQKDTAYYQPGIENLSLLTNGHQNFVISFNTKNQVDETVLHLAEIDAQSLQWNWFSSFDLENASRPLQIIQTNDQGYFILSISQNLAERPFYHITKTDGQGNLR